MISDEWLDIKEIRPPHNRDFEVMHFGDCFGGLAVIQRARWTTELKHTSDLRFRFNYITCFPRHPGEPRTMATVTHWRPLRDSAAARRYFASRGIYRTG